MNPVLVTLYGDTPRTCRAMIGGSRGPSVDLSTGSDELGFDWANLVSKIGQGIGKVAGAVGSARARKEKERQEAAEAARLRLIAASKRKTLLYVGVGGGVLLLAGGAFFLTRKRGKRGNR